MIDSTASFGGRRIVVVGQEPIGSALVSGLRAGGATVVMIETPESGLISSVVSDAVTELGGLDALVFADLGPAAGVRLEMADMTDQHIDDVWEVSMRACILSFQAAYAALSEASSPGSLVAVLPTMALSGAPGWSTTAAAAEGVRLLVKSVARQWGPQQITANVVIVANSVFLPGVPDFEFSLADRAFGHTGDVENDVAQVVGYLSTPASRFVTGSTLICDGGLWMTAP